MTQLGDSIDGLPSKLYRTIGEALQASEEVDLVLKGFRAEAMVLTDRRVIIAKAGAITSGSFGGRKLLSIDLPSVTSVEVIKHQLTVGYVIVRQAGMVAQDPRKARLQQDSPNIIAIRWGDVQEAHIWSNRVQEMAASERRGGLAGSGKPSIAGELRKWAELHDTGVLSDEEFAVQKAKLLAD
jgi:hypothetical protein